MTHKRTVVWVVCIVLLGCAGAAMLWSRYAPLLTDGPRLPVDLFRSAYPLPKPLQPFTLVDQDGQPFTLDHLRGRWTILFFGYTHCPDLCPTAMAVLGQLFGRLKDEAPQDLVNSQVAFVTVDPTRDTPAVVKPYVAYFNPGFKGLTGSVVQIDAFARQIGAYYFASPAPPPDASPSSSANQIGHTSSFFLIDPLGHLLAVFTEHNNADRVLEEYSKIRQYVRTHALYAEPEHNR
ncbi:MAG: SCO family protein [Magnetococcus sp. MYC-9]